MRVATLNLLHGIALRDLVTVPEPDPGQESGEPPATGPGRGRKTWSPPVGDDKALRRTAAELAEAGPLDIVGLQEVDRHQPRSGRADQTALIAEAVGARCWRFAASVRGTPGVADEGAAWVPATEHDDLPPERCDPIDAPDAGPRYGVSLISRWPVREWRVKRFAPAPVSLPLLAPTPGKPKAVRVPDEPRTAIAAIVELPHTDLTVAVAHLSFVPGYNTKQLQYLRAFLAGLPRPLLLLGDFNLPGTIPSLVTGWHQVARVPTYPVQKPRVQFDHILADGWTEAAISLAAESARALPMPVSDHCAVLADFPDP